MIFKRRKKQERDQVPTTLAVAFRVTGPDDQPVDPETLDAQTDALIELLGDVESHLFRDLDIHAVLARGEVAFSVEVVDVGVSPQRLLKELLASVVPAIETAGGFVVEEHAGDRPTHPSGQPVWHQEPEFV